MKARPVEKFKYANFEKKADEFYASMQEALQKRRWNAVGLTGIHCAISCCDALTAYFLGKRSAGERHEEVVELLKEIKSIDESEKKARITQILNILKPKTKVSYDSEIFRENEALDLAKRVERFYEWVKSILQKERGL
ncbi:MAG: HEPN domain-containing protein [Candidatus Micrarchaeota archaeon]